MGLLNAVLDKARSKVAQFMNKRYGQDFTTTVDTYAEAYVYRARERFQAAADLYFVALCYNSASEEKVYKDDFLVKQIHDVFGSYDPSTRFRWTNKLLYPQDLDQVVDAMVGIGAMNKFCEAHPDFSFEKLAGYFPNAAHMSIKKPGEAGAIADEPKGTNSDAG